MFSHFMPRSPRPTCVPLDLLHLTPTPPLQLLHSPSPRYRRRPHHRCYHRCSAQPIDSGNFYGAPGPCSTGGTGGRALTNRLFILMTTSLRRGVVKTITTVCAHAQTWIARQRKPQARQMCQDLHADAWRIVVTRRVCGK